MKADILQAYSSATDAREAALEFYASVAQPEMALAMFFCSSDYDLNAFKWLGARRQEKSGRTVTGNAASLG